MATLIHRDLNKFPTVRWRQTALPYFNKKTVKATKMKRIKSRNKALANPIFIAHTVHSDLLMRVGKMVEMNILKIVSIDTYIKTQDSEWLTETHGDSERLWETVRDLWRLMETLAHSESLRQTLRYSGRLWETHGDLGTLKETFEDFRSLKETFKSSENIMESYRDQRMNPESIELTIR